MRYRMAEKRDGKYEIEINVVWKARLTSNMRNFFLINLNRSLMLCKLIVYVLKAYTIYISIEDLENVKILKNCGVSKSKICNRRGKLYEMWKRY